MKAEYIIVHHTGAEEKDAEQVRRYHLSLGWRDVGYNYIIERDGRVVAGRSLTMPGAHCRDAGMNHKSAGVAVIGNLMDHPPTPEQRRALIGLVRELCRRYSVPPERVLGHNEVPGAATDCPGRFMDMARVRAEAAASEGDGETVTEDGGGPSGETTLTAGPAGLWRVQVGAFAKKENAEALAGKLRRDGYNVYIVKPSG